MATDRTRLHARVSRPFVAAVRLEATRRKREGLAGRRPGQLVELALRSVTDLELAEGLLVASRDAILAPQEASLRVDVHPDTAAAAELLAATLTMQRQSESARQHATGDRQLVLAQVKPSVPVRDIIVAAVNGLLAVGERSYTPYPLLGAQDAPEGALTEIEREMAVERFAEQVLATHTQNGPMVQRSTQRSRRRFRTVADIDRFLGELDDEDDA